MKNKIKPGSSILITGATGLIGGEIAARFARDHHGPIRCLVRAESESGAARRLTERLACSSYRPRPNADVRAVVGDVTRPGLGIAPDRSLDDYDFIIHAAGETSFLDERNCGSINVVGTERVVEFAVSRPRPPSVIFVSTATNVGRVSNTTVHEKGNCLSGARDDHHNGYTFSKARAEEAVRASGLDFLILRPSIVLADTTQDAKMARQILWFLPLLRIFDALPLDTRSRLDIIPASYFVDALWNLMSCPDDLYDCYHVSAGERFSRPVSEWLDLAREFYRWEKEITAIDPSAWNLSMHREQVGTKERRIVFGGLKHYLPFINMNVVFSNDRLSECIPSLSIRAPRDWVGPLLEQITYEDARIECLNP